MAEVTTVRYFAAAAEAAGLEHEEIAMPGGTVGDLRALLGRRHGEAMIRVLRAGAFLVDGAVERDDDVPLGDVVDVLPPFAGG